jgi:uncharacterized protein
MITIYVDADGCPVKNEIYRVASRYGIRVILVANARMRIPYPEYTQLVLVNDDFDAADDYIVNTAISNDIVVSADIPLASRCLKKGVRVLGPRGRVFDEASIGDALAMREILSHQRDLGLIGGGPAPIDGKDRSRFLQSLDTMIQALLKQAR